MHPPVCAAGGVGYESEVLYVRCELAIPFTGGSIMGAKRSIPAVAILLALVLMQGQAVGGVYYSGKQLVGLMREFEKSQTDLNSSRCDVRGYMSYVAGVYDATSGILWDDSAKLPLSQICAIVSKYLKKYPERWNESAATLVTDALMEAFPLPKRK